MRKAHAISLLGVVAALALGSPARAEPSMADKSESHALFEKALSEYKAQNWGEAVKHFLASQEKDPGVGTLLYLGESYKQLGKHASAWGAFKEAVSLAQKLSDKRVDVAKQKATETEGVLSTLTIDVPDSVRVEGLEVKRDGKVVSAGLWGSAVPVDGGSLTIEVSAPGYTATAQKVTVANTGGKARHVVAKLVRSAAAPTPAQPAGPAAGGGAHDEAASESGPYRTPALVGVGLGLVVGVFGGYKMVTAASKADDSRANNDQPAYRSAKSESNTGLLLAIGGGVVAVGSFTVFLVDPGGKKKVAVAPVAAPGFAGLSAGGRF